MKIDAKTQQQIALFLPDALEHAINLYNEQKDNAPTAFSEICDAALPPDSPVPPAQKKTHRKLSKTTDPFEQYLARLKGCLGQIEVLSKLATILADNDMFQGENQARQKELLHKAESLQKALGDIPDFVRTHIRPTPTSQTHHDPKSTTSH